MANKTYNWLGIASLVTLIVIFLIYLGIRKLDLTLIWSDFLAFLPYLFVGGISFTVGVLDLADKFPDFGLKLPLTNRVGWGYLVFTAIIPVFLYYGFLNYFPTIGIPKIGDVWLTAFVVALGFPMLIRSKFFSYTNASGDTVSVGFDQLYSRLTKLFVKEIDLSSQVSAKRTDLLNKFLEIFTTDQELKDEATAASCRPDWDAEEKKAQDDKLAGILALTDAGKKKMEIANYILRAGGADYMKTRMLAKDSSKANEIANTVKLFKNSAVFLSS
jgi:hypothetical protein